MERPRILILGKLPPPLMGPAIATKIILESSLNDDFDLHHFDTRINDSVADMGTFKMSKLTAVRKKYRDFKHKLKEVKPELVLIPISQTTTGFFKDLPFIRMAAKSGAKVLVQLRGSAFGEWFDGLSPIVSKQVRKGLAKTDGVIVLGENLRYIFEQFYAPSRIFVVPNGGDYQFPSRKSKGIQVTYLANYLPGKAIYEVLEAMAILKEKCLSEFRFEAYGSWDSEDYKQACSALIAKHELDHCRLNGSVYGDEKWQVLADSDVFVFTPKHPEGHPWSLVEASAAGLAIVSTDRGAIRQNVKHGENGFLLDDPAPEQIASCLEKLIRDENLRESMGRASRSLHESAFTSKKMVENLGRVFEKTLAKECAE